MTGTGTGRATRRRIGVDLSSMAVGHGIFSLGQWVVGAAIAKLAGVEAMAAYGLALAIGGPIYFLANMGLRSAVARDATRCTPAGDYWSARFWAILLTAGVMTVIGLTVGQSRGLDGVTAILLFAAMRSVDCLFDLIYGLHQRDGANWRVARSLARRGFLAPLACVVGIWLADGALWAGLAGWALALLALFAFAEAKSFKALLRLEPKHLGGMAVVQRAWPLGVGAACNALEMAIPRYVVEWRLEPEALGYFTAVFLIAMAPIVVAAAFGNAALSHLGRAFADGNKRGFVRLTMGLAALGGLSGVAALAFVASIGGPMLESIYTAEYRPYAGIFTIAVAAAAFRAVASLLQFAMIALGWFKAHMAVHGALAPIAAILAWPLVGAYGLEGAALSLLAIAVLQCLILLFLFAFAVNRAFDGRDRS